MIKFYLRIVKSENLATCDVHWMKEDGAAVSSLLYGILPVKVAEEIAAFFKKKDIQTVREVFPFPEMNRERHQDMLGENKCSKTKKKRFKN